MAVADILKSSPRCGDVSGRDVVNVYGHGMSCTCGGIILELFINPPREAINYTMSFNKVFFLFCFVLNGN